MENQTIKIMKKAIISAVSILIILVLLPHCYYDSEEYIYGKSACNTTNISYANDISLIMNQHCNSCHNQSVPSGSVITDNYASLLKIANDGRLWQTTSSGSMPKSGKLDDCTINKIKAWLDNGAKNN